MQSRKKLQKYSYMHAAVLYLEFKLWTSSSYDVKDVENIWYLKVFFMINIVHEIISYYEINALQELLIIVEFIILKQQFTSSL